MIDRSDTDAPASHSPNPDEPGAHDALSSPAEYAAALPDNALVDWTVADQAGTDPPSEPKVYSLENSSDLLAHRASRDAVWSECGKRGLQDTVRERIAERFKLLEERGLL